MRDFEEFLFKIPGLSAGGWCGRGIDLTRVAAGAGTRARQLLAGGRGSLVPGRERLIAGLLAFLLSNVGGILNCCRIDARCRLDHGSRDLSGLWWDHSGYRLCDLRSLLGSDCGYRGGDLWGLARRRDGRDGRRDLRGLGRGSGGRSGCDLRSQRRRHERTGGSSDGCRECGISGCHRRNSGHQRVGIACSSIGVRQLGGDLGGLLF